MSLAQRPCPACPERSVPEFIEAHKDRIGGREYRILRCPACGVTFSEPREAVGADWYEKAAPIRARERRPSPAGDWRYRKFLAAGLPPGKLLDVGCGDGGFLRLAAERGFKPSGFDYEKRMIDLARSRGIRDAECAEFGAYCRSRRDAEFDYITLFDVLEHTPEPGAFISELKRILKPGGHLALTLPNARRPLPWGRDEHDFPPHHFTRWTPEAMRGFLERNGFEIVQQDVSTLKISFLAENFFFRMIMPGVLGSAKRLLFGRTKGSTLTELYDKNPSAGSPLADKLTRQRLVDAFKGTCSVITYPAAAAMTLFYKMREPGCGDYIYMLARRRYLEK